MKKIKNILATVLLFLLIVNILGAKIYPVYALSENEEYTYKDKVFELLELERYENNSEFNPISYRELYMYYCPASVNGEIPDYVLVSLYTNIYEAMPVCEVFGEYLIADSIRRIPYELGYYVYLPQKDIVYDLSYAYELQIEGIEEVFTECGIGRLIGDMDKDRKITIKDATYIQKCLANIQEFDYDDYIDGFSIQNNPPLMYISDFNRDCKRNIKDATAIQKYLAKMEY